jgi:hypothetical protein
MLDIKTLEVWLWEGTSSAEIGFPLFGCLENITLRKTFDNLVVTG